VEKIIISYRCLESNLAFYPVARRYTDWAEAFRNILISEDWVFERNFKTYFKKSVYVTINVDVYKKPIIVNTISTYNSR
jgi:hypothetical protein